MKHKTRTKRVYNETTGWYETREVELKGYTFTDDDRILIVREWCGRRENHQEVSHQQPLSAVFLDGQVPE